jgi:plasmid stabilization system protein ParE
MYLLKFHPQAVIEIEDAIHWYEERSLVSVQKLKNELLKSFRIITTYPFSVHNYYKSFRSYFLKTFPYRIVYSVSGKTVYIIAVFHTSRNPELLRKRIESL